MVKSNREFGSDFEDSEAVFIEAHSESDAIAWGRRMANEFFGRIFDGDTIRVTVDDYAHWIEPEPSMQFPLEQLTEIPVVIAGQDEASEQVVSSWLRKT